MRKDQFDVWWGDRKQYKTRVSIDKLNMVLVEDSLNQVPINPYSLAKIWIIEGILCCKGPLTGGHKTPLRHEFQIAYQKYVNNILEKEILLKHLSEELDKDEQ